MNLKIWKNGGTDRTKCVKYLGERSSLKGGEEKPDQEGGQGRSEDRASRWYRGKGRRERSFKKEFIHMLEVSR